MSCAEAMRRLSAALSAPPALPAAPSHSAVAANRLIARWAVRPARAVPGLDAVARRLLDAQRYGQWYKLDRHDWRLVPLLLWRDTQSLAVLPGVVDRLCAHLSGEGDPVLLRRLIYAFLLYFHSGLPMFEEVAAALRRALAADRSTSLHHWRLAQDHVQLFDVERGPLAVARYASAREAGRLDPNGLDRALASLGLGGALSRGGFAQATLRAAVIDLAPGLVAGTIPASRLSSLVDGLEDERASAGKEWAEVLLRPWVSAAPAPEAARAAIIGVLSRLLGDPRLRPENWKTVDRRLSALMTAWVVSHTVESFFQPTTDTQSEPDHRGAFWMAYARQGAIEDAGLALPAGAPKGQAALLMVIGSLIIVEWPQAGKCRLWNRGASASPRLRQAEYTMEELRQNSLRLGELTAGLSHKGGDRGLWQERLASFIRAQTGVEPPRDSGAALKFGAS